MRLLLQNNVAIFFSVKNILRDFCTRNMRAKREEKKTNVPIIYANAFSVECMRGETKGPSIAFVLLRKIVVFWSARRKIMWEIGQSGSPGNWARLF